MKSILDNTALDDFIALAEMNDEEFDVHRATAKNEIILVDTENSNKRAQQYTLANFDYKQIPIPRKPLWNYSMTAEEVDRNEKESFLNWRRNISMLENIAFEREQKRITPFEKNLEVWRQLWRVCERSHYLFQVVDARNPLLYYTTGKSP